MRSKLHDLALIVGFEVVNVEDGYTDYEYNQKLSGVESVSHIIKIYDEDTNENALLTFEAIVNVLPKDIRKRVYKLVKRADIVSDDKAIELAIFAIEEYKAKCDYSRLKEYGELLGVDIQKLGYAFSYSMQKKDVKGCLAKIEQALPMEYAPVLGKIKKLEYKIGYLKNNKSLIKS